MLAHLWHDELSHMGKVSLDNLFNSMEVIPFYDNDDNHEIVPMKWHVRIDSVETSQETKIINDLFNEMKKYPFIYVKETDTFFPFIKSNPEVCTKYNFNNADVSIADFFLNIFMDEMPDNVYTVDRLKDCYVVNNRTTSISYPNYEYTLNEVVESIYKKAGLSIIDETDEDWLDLPF